MAPELIHPGLGEAVFLQDRPYEPKSYQFWDPLNGRKYIGFTGDI